MVHLHVRSCYSLLQSPFRIEEIIQSAKENNMNTVALSDHNVMFGAMAFYHQAKKAGIKPVLGMESEFVTDGKLIRLNILAQNDEGLKNLYRLSTKISQIKEPLSLQEASSHLTNCIAITMAWNDDLEKGIYHGDKNLIEFLLNQAKAHVPNLYVGISKNDSKLHQEQNLLLKQTAEVLNIPSAALSIILYQKEEDVQQLKILRAIERQTIVSDQTLDVSYQRHFRDSKTMEALYEKEDLKATEEIAEKCNVTLEFQKSGLPAFENKLGIASDEYLLKLCQAGLKKRMRGNIPENYQKRLNYELDTILKMGFTDYFLIVWDFIRYARSKNIYVGPGRGSAAGSLVAYCLGITHIDPIANHLFFERFLNPERISLPDIDTDVPDNRRQEVIDYLYEKYGDDHVSQIVTFSNMKARSVLRDIGRVMTYPVRMIDSLAKLIPNTPGMNLKKAYETVPAFKKAVEQDSRHQQLFALGLKLEGLPRHTSIHAGGVVLSNQIIENVCPRIQIDEHTMATQFSMEYLEELGLIKMDILALRNLTIIDEVVQNIKKFTDVSIPILRIPLNDPKTYELLDRADTVGVFQLESEGIKNVLLQMQPKVFEDISQVIALYRPGPMQNIHIYMQQRRQPHTIKYIHPSLIPILKDTYGIIVYQEQIMQIAQEIGGFTLAQADSLRKAMSKKKHDQMMMYRDDFINGAKQKNLNEQEAQGIFDLMERFANYGFNKSHSYAYGLIVYQMAWLKANYPLFFYQSLLNSVIGSEKKTAEYVSECKRRNIEILPADINESGLEYSITKNGLRMPLTCLKGFGKAAAQKLLQERSHKPFDQLFETIARLSAAKIGESQQRLLIQAGALDGFGSNRATLLKNLPRMIEYGNLIRIDGHEMLFDESVVSKPQLVVTKESTLEKVKAEYEIYGFYISAHPIENLRRRFYQTAIPIRDILPMQGFVQLVGRIVSIKMHKTKNGAQMCFLTVEDESQKIDIAVMPNLLTTIEEQLANGRVVFIQGNKDRAQSLLARKIDFIQV